MNWTLNPLIIVQAIWADTPCQVLNYLNLNLNPLFLLHITGIIIIES